MAYIYELWCQFNQANSDNSSVIRNKNVMTEVEQHEIEFNIRIDIKVKRKEIWKCLFHMKINQI
jgi:hypothetical protein